MARDKYGPIESNPAVTPQDKEKSMLEWWKTTQSLMVSTRLTKERIRVCLIA